MSKKPKAKPERQGMNLEDFDFEMKIYLRRWSEVAQVLRERKIPLPSHIAAALADHIDPNVKEPKGRVSAPWEINNRDRLLCHCLGWFRALVGTKDGPIDLDDAFFQTCETMKVSESTLSTARRKYPEVVKSWEQAVKAVLKARPD